MMSSQKNLSNKANSLNDDGVNYTWNVNPKAGNKNDLDAEKVKSTPLTPSPLYFFPQILNIPAHTWSDFVYRKSYFTKRVLSNGT